MRSHRIAAHERTLLSDGDVIKFGNEVTRGPGTWLYDDDVAPFEFQQPIRWIAMTDEYGRRIRSNVEEFPESFPPLHVAVNFNWTWPDDR